MIEYDHNSIRIVLERDPELTAVIRKEVEYLARQYKHSKQREFLVDTTIANLIKTYHEYGMQQTTDTNEEPF